LHQGITLAGAYAPGQKIGIDPSGRTALRNPVL